MRENTQMTNADRIRALTNEQLAERLQEWDCPPNGLDPCAETCTICWLKWLQKPAEVQGSAKNKSCWIRWIPVTERLPEKSGDYITTACDEGAPHGEGIWYDTVVVVASYYDGCWTWYENETEYDLSDIVTHWMPFPQPAEVHGNG